MWRLRIDLMKNKIITQIKTMPLSIEEAVLAVQDVKFGALDLFVGTVRATNFNRAVTKVCYDLFDPLTLKILQDICQEAANNTSDPASIYVAHFKGELPVLGVSIIIAVATPHRREAFSICRAILEDIKTRAPIWKQEYYIDGHTEWVQGHALCQH